MEKNLRKNKMFYHNIDPVFLNIGGLQITYYGMIYALGFVITYFMLNYFAKKRKIKNLNKDSIETLMIYAILSTVIGARLFEVIFYHPVYYFRNPLEIFMLWKGGLSFHGSLFGVAITYILFCKYKKVNFFKLADITVIPVAIALCLGRLANFINGELYGTITKLPWGVKFKNVEGFRHPSQIYESLKNLVVFSVLFISEKKKKLFKWKLKDGMLVSMFLILYGLFRFLIEFVKDLPVVFLGMKMGQVLSLVMIIVGVVMFIRINKNKEL